MKLKPNLEEYIKKQDIEKIYDYQKKAFDMKIEDLQSNIKKIEDCLSLRFGEDLNNNKYNIELEKIKKQLDDLVSNSIDDKKMKLELDKISFDVRVEIENKINEEKEKLEKLSEETANEINKILEETKITEKENAKSTEKYIEDLKMKLEEIAKDGRSRTAIGKQEKTIKALEADRKEINEQIENINYFRPIKSV